jgi:hypothetical protein
MQDVKMRISPILHILPILVEGLTDRAPERLELT